MKKENLFFLIFFQLIFGTGSWLNAQDAKYSISGIVYDEANKQPVEFATIVIKEHKKKAVTNDKGEFVISLEKPGEYNLVISAADLQPLDAVVKVTEASSMPAETFYLKLRKIKGATLDINGKRDIQSLARHTMKQEEIKEIPATLGDSVNALGSFAGIDQFAFIAGLGPLIIRGADAFSNRFYVDGIPVNSVQHMLGLHSVINNDLIDKIDVYSSAAPVKFGNSALGGIIEINTIDSVKKLGGHFELGMLSANGSISAPILADSKNQDSAVGYWFAGGRYGYLTALLPPILKAINGESPGLPQYYDYSAKGKYYFNKQHSLTVMLLGFGDTQDSSPASDKTNAQSIADGADPLTLDITSSLRISSHIQSIGYVYSPSEKLVNTLKLYSALNESYQYQNNTNANAPSWLKNLERTSNPHIFGIKDDLIFKLFNNLSTTRIGAEITYYDFFARGKGLVPRQQFNGGLWSGASLTEAMFDVVNIDQKSSNFVYSGYLEEKVELGGLTIAGGVRADYFDNDNLYTIDPRGFISYEFPTNTVVSVGAGTYGSFVQTNYLWFSQAPEIADVTGLEVEKAIHRTAGIEQKIADILSIKLEGFYNTWNHLFQPAANIVVDGKTAFGLNSGERTAYGFEVTIAREKMEARDDFYGWINYTYMDGKQKTGLPLTYDPQGDQWINNEFVRNHSLKIVAGYKFGQNTLGARFRLMSSLPYTPVTGDDGNPFGIGRYGQVYGKRFSEFYPLYHQLDIRFSRSTSYKWGKISWYIEIQDIYNNHTPVQSWKYNEPYKAGTNPVISTTQGLALLPSFGVEINF